jgi:hypothetical protein
MKRWFTMNPANGRIEGEPINLISVGGNYIVRRRYRDTDSTRYVRTLRGKATSGGDIEIINGRKSDFVRFTADPVTGMAARSELAPRRLSEFGKTITLKLEFRVRAPRIDELTGYVLQFWQPVISPIAGVRVSNGRLEVVARSGGTAASTSLNKDWNELTIAFKPGPDGLLRVRNDMRGKLSGTLNGGSQASQADADLFRPKFGWYGPLSQSVQVDYRHFAMFVT